MDHPVREPVIHHSRQLRKLDAVAVEVDSAGRAVKSEVKDSIVPLAKKIEVVLELFARIAGQVAKLRVHGLRDQL